MFLALTSTVSRAVARPPKFVGLSGAQVFTGAQGEGSASCFPEEEKT